MDTNPSKQRQQFYRDYASGQWSMSELCETMGLASKSTVQGHLLGLERRGWVDIVRDADGHSVPRGIVVRGDPLNPWAIHHCATLDIRQ